MQTQQDIFNSAERNARHQIEEARNRIVNLAATAICLLFVFALMFGSVAIHFLQTGGN